MRVEREKLWFTKRVRPIHAGRRASRSNWPPHLHLLPPLPFPTDILLHTYRHCIQVLSPPLLFSYISLARVQRTSCSVLNTSGGLKHYSNSTAQTNLPSSHTPLRIARMCYLFNLLAGTNGMANTTRHWRCWITGSEETRKSSPV